MKHTAGILVYRHLKEEVEILLVHPGGPFYAKKDTGVWSVPKGEYDPATEDAFEVAKREFHEETGNSIQTEKFTQLKPVKSKGGKLIQIWAAEENFIFPFVCSNLFEMEWPPNSGNLQAFPETDRAEWFTFEEAQKKINSSQLPILKELEELLIKAFK